MDQYIGRLLDNRYEILEIIGTGGMAVVYKARCHRLNRLVAIKILKDELVEGKDSVTIDITYYDYAKAPITINYSPKPVKSSDLAKFETQKYVIKKTDTKNWKTERITINDINLNNSCSYGTDIVITSQPMSQTVIKDIKIVS